MSKKIPLWNFSWVRQGVIAGSAGPVTDRQFEYLLDKGIEVIINLADIHYEVSDELKDKFYIYNLSITDYSIPTELNITEFWSTCKKHMNQNNPIVVHCYAGCGRTGTMLALWILLTQQVKTGIEAIHLIRRLRPCSIETEEQEQFIKEIGTNIQIFIN